MRFYQVSYVNENIHLEDHKSKIEDNETELLDDSYNLDILEIYGIDSVS